MILEQFLFNHFDITYNIVKVADQVLNVGAKHQSYNTGNPLYFYKVMADDCFDDAENNACTTKAKAKVEAESIFIDSVNNYLALGSLLIIWFSFFTISFIFLSCIDFLPSASSFSTFDCLFCKFSGLYGNIRCYSTDAGNKNIGTEDTNGDTSDRLDWFTGKKVQSIKLDIDDIDADSIRGAILSFNDKYNFLDEYSRLSSEFGLVVGIKVFFDGEWRTLFHFLRFSNIILEDIVNDTLQRYDRVDEYYHNINFDVVQFISHVIHLDHKDVFITDRKMERKVGKVRVDNRLFPITMDFTTWGPCEQLSENTFKIILKSSYVIIKVYSSATQALTHSYTEYSNSGTKLTYFKDYWVSSYIHFTRVIGKASRTYNNNNLVYSTTRYNKKYVTPLAKILLLIQPF